METFTPRFVRPMLLVAPAMLIFGVVLLLLGRPLSQFVACVVLGVVFEVMYLAMVRTFALVLTAESAGIRYGRVWSRTVHRDSVKSARLRWPLLVLEDERGRALMRIKCGLWAVSDVQSFIAALERGDPDSAA